LASGCLIGADASKPLVLVMGDSHARHLVPGLADVGRAEGIRLLPAVKSSCLIFPFPEARLHGVLARRQARCASFHESVLRGLPMLKAKYGLTGVIIAGRWQRDRKWETSLPRYVQAMRAQGLRVVLVSDIPGYSYSVPRCVAHKGAADCRGSRAAIAQTHARDLATLREIARATPGVVVRVPLDALCTQTSCEVAEGETLLYTDANHLSYAGSARLGRYLSPSLEWVAGGAAPSEAGS
jgi:hypothetical protein